MPEIVRESQKKYIKSFRKDVDPLLVEMEEFAIQNRVPILDWNSAELLERIIQMNKPKNVLEIGTAIGYSSIRIANFLRKKGKLDTIEKSLDNISLANGYFERCSVATKINLLQGDALEIMPNLKKKYDLIFLDADKEDYEKLFYYSLMLLKNKGIMFVDNLLWHGFTAARSVPKKFKNSTKMIRSFNELFMNQPNLKSSIFPIGDGIGIGIKTNG